jgi:hypothetical protein
VTSRRTKSHQYGIKPRNAFTKFVAIANIKQS